MTDQDTAEQLADIVEDQSQIAAREAALQLELERDTRAHARQTMETRHRVASLDIDQMGLDRRTERLATMAFAAMGVGLTAFIIGVVHVLWAH